MHPNAYLQSMWRPEVKDQVFVAMSFHKVFHDRYNQVIKPAIEDEPIEGHSLTAYRVDNSKTGDSILTEIVGGIAHSRIVLADLSVMDRGRNTDVPLRNGNVMYEVGVALASRHPSEVLLVRDDSEPFLFDVSTIPHQTIDFSNVTDAKAQLRLALSDRIRETQLINDARIQMAARTITDEEFGVLQGMRNLGPGECRNMHTNVSGVSIIPNPVSLGLSRLIQKGCVRTVAIEPESGIVYYSLTRFGHALAKLATETLGEVAVERVQAGPTEL